jgi:pyruvate/2-oxoglutarate/acetoin dehydrogenase E1 component
VAKVRFRQAVAQGLADEMRIDRSVVVFGEDVAEAGGPFKTSEGLLAEFGPLRVRDTPISEMGFSGAAVGAAVMGLKPVIEIMFMEFLGVALDMVVTEAAKFHYMSGGKFSVPMVVRASVGSGGGFGLQHSQTLENWLAATPGLKVVVPSDVQSAYGLIRAAIRDAGPVVVLEPRILYPERDELVVGEEGIIEIGKARTLRVGSTVTVVTLGQMVSITLKGIQDSELDAEVIDLSTLVPWDRETIYNSVRRTGRLVVVEEAPESGGWGNEIVSSVSTHLFNSLKAAPFRICTPNVPVPYGKDLETRYMPQPEYVAQQLSEYLSTGEPPKAWWAAEGFVS